MYVYLRTKCFEWSGSVEGTQSPRRFPDRREGCDEVCGRERGPQVSEDRSRRKQHASKLGCRTFVPTSNSNRGRTRRDREGRRNLTHNTIETDWDRANLGTSVQNIFASRRTCLPVWSHADSIAEMTSTPAQLSLRCTTMLRKFGKTVREKLDHIESRADQPGPHSSSRHGGGHHPTPGDFPTQGDFFKFRKQRGVNLGASPTFPIRCDSYLTASRLVVCVGEVDCRSSVSGSSPARAK